MKKGFTLMEILAVLLVLAVIASFAVPVVRSVLDEARYRKARVAATKMAEAMRSFYRSSRGTMVTGSLVGNDAANLTGDCVNPALSGLPTRSFSGANLSPVGPTSPTVEDLFRCQYLSAKDFAGLKYEFSAGIKGPFGSSYAVQVTNQTGNTKPNFKVYWNGEIKLEV